VAFDAVRPRAEAASADGASAAGVAGDAVRPRAEAASADGASAAGAAGDAVAGAAGAAAAPGTGAGAGKAFASAEAVEDGVTGFGVGLAAAAEAGSFGPDAASALLRSATRLWVSFCRSAAVVARVGGGGTLARFG
jgi:hypothetical protein